MIASASLRSQLHLRLEEEVLYKVILLTTSIFSLLVNTLIVVFILLKRPLKKKKSASFFINQFSSHVVSSATDIATILMQVTSTTTAIHNCLLSQLFISILLTTSDRHLTIKYPFGNPCTRTVTRVAILIAASWLLPALRVTIFGAAGVGDSPEAGIGIFFVALVGCSVVYSNIDIYLISRRHVATIRKNSVELPLPSHKRVQKSTKVCLLIVLSFVLLWCPLGVRYVLLLVAKKSPYIRFFTGLSVISVRMYSLVDPFLYLSFNKDAKREIRKLSKTTQKNSIATITNV